MGAGPQSRRLHQRAQIVTPGGVHSPVRAFGHVDDQPLFIESASGATLHDVDGNTYIDFCMAFGPLILGHAAPSVRAAVMRAIDDGWSYGTAERYSTELVERMQSFVRAAEQVRFVNSGTEAVMTALRLARGFTGRQTLLKFAGCYHGHTDSMLVEAGSGMAGEPMSAGVTAGVASDTLVVALDDDQALEQVFADHGDSIAAAIIEPLPANHGLLPQRSVFLERLRTLCTQSGSLLIFDEVISGFRVSRGGYAEIAGIEPDLFTWGKVIGGGFPVGAIAGRTDCMSALSPAGPVYQAGTLSANPVAMRAGSATLDALDDGNVYRQLDALGTRLEAGFDAIDTLSLVRQGSVFWLCKTPGARSAGAFDQHRVDDFRGLFEHLLERGVYIAPSPYEVGFLSSAHSEAHIDQLIAACAEWQPRS